MRIILILFSLIITTPVLCRTIIVRKNLPVSSLKKAIELAKDKDTILLQPGIYKEGGIIITKAITVIGINYPVLDGESKYEIMILSGKNISVSGIYFKDSRFSSYNDYSAISIIDATNIIIENNKIFNAQFAIHILNSTYCTIHNNYILGQAK